ncbi:MAG: ATP-grasp domain-containing protein [Bacilli bacterium]
MNAIVIGASLESVYAINKAKEMGITVYAIDGDSSAYGLTLADYSAVIDIKDIEAVSNYVEQNNIDFVIPVPIGKFLTTIGQINDKFDFKGISYNAALNCIDKWEFHQLLNKKGLRNTESFLYNSELKKVLNTAFPVIAKPRFGSGSKGVVELETVDEVSKLIKGLDEDYIIEEKFKGTEYGVDCQVINGDFDIILIREKENTPPPFMQAVGYYSKFETNYKGALNKDVSLLLKQVTEVIGLDNCLIHVDLLVSEDELFIVELSGRPSGHNLHNNFTIKATGFDMVENYLNYQINNKNNVNIEKKCVAIHYYNLESGIVKSIPTDEFMSQCLEYKLNVALGDVIDQINNGPQLMSRGYFIVEGKNREELDLKIASVLNEFKVGG